MHKIVNLDPSLHNTPSNLGIPTELKSENMKLEMRPEFQTVTQKEIKQEAGVSGTPLADYSASRPQLYCIKIIAVMEISRDHHRNQTRVLLRDLSAGEQSPCASSGLLSAVKTQLLDHHRQVILDHFVCMCICCYE